MDPILEGYKQLVVRFLASATNYRADECLSLMTPDATWWVLGDPRSLRVAGTKDRAQIAKLLHGLAKFIPQPMELSIKGVTAEGVRIAVEAECFGISRNGSKYHNTYHFLFEVHAGLISRVREYMDTLHLFETMRRDISAQQ
jgi:hypothetical protein